MTPVMTSDLRPCVVSGAYSISQQRLAAKPSSLPSSSSPSTSPKLHDLSPPPFSKCLPAGTAVPHQCPQSPIPHVSIIQETPGRYQPPSLYQPSSSSSSPTSQPSTPTDAPFSPTLCKTQPVSSGSTSPGAQQHPKAAERGRSSLQEDGSPPTLTVSIKQEPQELDQMYLDDGEWKVFLLFKSSAWKELESEHTIQAPDSLKKVFIAVQHKMTTIYLQVLMEHLINIRWLTDHVARSWNIWPSKFRFEFLFGTKSLWSFNRFRWGDWYGMVSMNPKPAAVGLRLDWKKVELAQLWNSKDHKWMCCILIVSSVLVGAVCLFLFPYSEHIQTFHLFSSCFYL